MESHHPGQPEFNEETFFNEVDHPHAINDPHSQSDYRFYLLNRAYEGEQPLVVYNGLGSTPNTLIGQQHLRSYAEAIPRPIIAPMNIHASGMRNRRGFADGHAWALQQITNEPVDVTGMSWGSVLAFSVAESLQDQADTLVTAASVGTRRHLSSYALRVPLLFLKEQRQIRTAATVALQDTDIRRDAPHTTPSLDRFDKLQRVRLIGRQTFQQLPKTLHSRTTWHDIIGANDILSRWRDHAATIETRNQLHPGSSSISVVHEHGHFWSHMRPALAHLVRQVLDDNRLAESPQQTIAYYRTRRDFSGIDPISSPGDAN